MRIYLTSEKMANVKSICTKLDASQVTIRDVVQALGYIVSSFPGDMFGPLYFRQRERDKTEALKCNKGVVDAFMTISNSYNVISHGDPTIVVFTHVSSTGWGCSLNNISTGGNWTAEEANNHLNYLELLGIFLALQSFSLTIKGQLVKVMVDNITALSDLNHMGTSSSEKRSDLAKEIWLWCAEQNIWLTAVHVPGVGNVEADRQSRLRHSPLEWTLVNTVFKDCISELNVLPTIDLFASRISHQLPIYVSWRPDSGAVAVDAFHLSWK